MSTPHYVVLLATISLAYAVFGMTGFGAAMVAVPILVQILPLEFAVPLILLLDVVATVSVAVRNHNHMALPELGRLLPPMLFGVFLGATILARVKSSWLLIALGVFVLAMTARNFLMRRSAQSPVSWKWSMPAGVTGGIFSALFGTGGPIYTMYLSRRLPEMQQFRATIAAVIFLSAIVRSGAFAPNGLLFKEGLLRTALYCLPFCGLGLFIGSRIRQKVSQQVVKNLLLGLLCAGAVGAIYRGIFP